MKIVAKRVPLYRPNNSYPINDGSARVLEIDTVTTLERYYRRVVPYIFFRRRRNGTSQMQRKGIYDGATPLYPYITFVDEHFDG